MSETLFKHEAAIYHEMLIHPALFTHPHPKKIAIIHDGLGLVTEACKHQPLVEIWHIVSHKNNLPVTDARVKSFLGDVNVWIKKQPCNELDVLIIAEPPKPEKFDIYVEMLQPEGILIQQGDSPFQSQSLKTLLQRTSASGFQDAQIIHFPEPHNSPGWRSAIMAIKQGTFRRVREKDIFNKTFPTRYYNFDMHKAALAIPEFMREAEIF